MSGMEKASEEPSRVGRSVVAVTGGVTYCLACGSVTQNLRISRLTHVAETYAKAKPLLFHSRQHLLVISLRMNIPSTDEMNTSRPLKILTLGMILILNEHKLQFLVISQS
jgi:hypothetical protein